VAARFAGRPSRATRPTFAPGGRRIKRLPDDTPDGCAGSSAFKLKMSSRTIFMIRPPLALDDAADDLFLNRGDNSIVRIDQSGTVQARRLLVTSVPGFRAAGIGVSPDARTIWVSGTVPGGGGVVLKAAAFGQGAVTEAMLAAASAGDEVAQGSDLFVMDMDAARGLGPLFNSTSCASCHFAPSIGGMGTTPESFVLPVGRATPGVYSELLGHGGPVSRQNVVDGCGVSAGLPAAANVASLRSAMTLRGTSPLDFIREVDVDAARAAQPEAVRGHKILLADGLTGRFGWKAHSPTLVEFMGEALRDEMGVTSSLQPRDLFAACGADDPAARADGVAATALVAFLNQTDPPAPGATCLVSSGAAVFSAIGCASCHTPSFSGPGARQIHAYTDLLLHDMGPGLADGIVAGSAGGSDFRTAPLWRVSERDPFLHDGRAATIEAAILEHGGQASGAADAYRALDDAARQALRDFLDCI
jgi:hypothetical protein